MVSSYRVATSASTEPWATNRTRMWPSDSRGRVMTKLGTFDELMNETDESLRPIARRLRDVILQLHPQAVEIVPLGDRAATYGFGPRKMPDGYVYILPYTKWVNLGFYAGADLPDPERLLQGTGAKLLHVKVRDVAGADEPALRELIRAAYHERGRALGVL